MLGDETGFINAIFIGDSAKLIEQDAVLAIRNGKMQIVDESMRVSIDRFGKLTSEPDHECLVWGGAPFRASRERSIIFYVLQACLSKAEVLLVLLLPGFTSRVSVDEVTVGRHKVPNFTAY